MNNLKINCKKGVNDILFGMSPKETERYLGTATQQIKTAGIHEDEWFLESEMRDSVKFLYEENQLVCVLQEFPSTCFVLNGEKIPSTLPEAVAFLQDKSLSYVCVPEKVFYIFRDLGIAIFPRVNIDVDNGVKQRTKIPRIAVCNDERMQWYYEAFMG